MGIDFADVDHDGKVDFFVVDMLSRDPRLRKRQQLAEKPLLSPIGAIDHRPQAMRNTLFRNQGDETFAEVAWLAGVAASDWSWSPIFLDVDLDGWEDLLISAGHFRDVQDYDAERQIQARQGAREKFKSEAERQKAFTQELMEHYRLYPPLNMPVVGFRNLGQWKFEEMTQSWGLEQPGVHHGMATADLDGDGDLDVVVNNLNGPAGLYRNESSAPRVNVRLRGRGPNTQGIGSVVTLRHGAVAHQFAEIVAGGRYLSASDAVATFAAGSASQEMTLEIKWRSGVASRIEAVQPNTLYIVDESEGPRTVPETPKAPQPFFEEVKDFSWIHAETAFNDFERQPLLPFRLSQNGPGVAWFDLDGDGRDELIVGAPNGGAAGVFRFQDQNGFKAALLPGPGPVASDMAGIVGHRDASGKSSLLYGLTGQEVKLTNALHSARWMEGKLSNEPFGPDVAASASGLAIGLPDTGGLALFVGGGAAPGQYPIGAPSKLYRLHPGGWRLDSTNSPHLQNLGIVNGAVWSDLTGDGFSELILACEWGPIRVFQSRRGLFFEMTEALGLSPHTGWWKGVTTGDFNNDGRLDIAASNWGLNSPWQASVTRPLVFAFGQFAQPGVTDIIETEYFGNELAPARQFFRLTGSLPFLLETFPSHKAYSEASLAHTLGARAGLARKVRVNTLDTTVFLNQGGRFTLGSIPLEAQMAPAFSVNVGDLDGDGNEDIFLSQNFFAARAEVGRIDAGRGLWLKGDGHGKFKALSAVETGVAVYGEQRGAALGDFDEDGRVDLAVSQNGAALKLFHNLQARPGLRVRLLGPPENPQAYGAVLRLFSGSTPGPAREIHGGSGYLSQDSATQVLSAPGNPDSLWIRWPGGRISNIPLPQAFREIVVNADGAIVSKK